ncbi:hypothetical protein AGABI2DRAFT_114375 [Agaricus bisporus var. bisporus H97]|uniref:hypothetical protein n=1 Tax=Agaricus bisporus var. bisporus (strain H97 / ATCC MYA-4626 / FGSC 10389) TaxID=936046 RepID=UPI00029F5EF9|nr:hypothetical protein AGABI2DRAFT_114375 [Agaricus bisporus var. bisporus H97]EKV51655.1 hypothetical protein AGABI2DRAFT_114375 [Agaricus bisporus var. bisporus H97]
MTSSFSSFPASFSTFPDLEAESIKKSEKSQDKDRRSEKPKKGKDKGKDRDRSRDKGREKRKGHDRASERDLSGKGVQRERNKEGREENGERERHREHKLKRKQRDKDKRAKSPSFRDDAGDQGFSMDLKRHEQSYRLYFSDTKGDALTLQYGGLYAGDIPRYHLYGGGRQILGLSKAWAVFRRAGKGIEVGLKGAHKHAGLADPGTRSLLAIPAKSLLPSATPSSKYEEIDGVIRLPGRRGHRRPEESYRAIEVSRAVDSDSDFSSSSARDSDSESERSSSPELTSHQGAIKKLEQHLAEDPTSESKWLSLVNQSLSTIPITSRNATKARSEITVAILSRAFSAEPKNISSKLLRLRYMKAGEEIWQEVKLKEEWEETLKAGGTEIWMEWLEWRIRSCTKIVDDLVEDVLRVYAALDNDIGEAQELSKLRVFWRLATVYRNAGFTEKAMAMFQAQAELCFKVPQALVNEPLEVRLRELEEFWDCEAPRIGEEGARGWREWYSSGKPETINAHTTTVAKQDSGQVAQLDPYRQWAFHEIQQDELSLLPAKSFDESAEDDPYSTVLLSDIRSIIFEVRHSNTLDALRLAWLSFLGLHIPGFATSLSSDHEANWDDRWNMGYLTTRPYLDAIFRPDRTAGCSQPNRQLEQWGGNAMDCLDMTAHASKELRSWWNEEDIAGVNALIVRRIFAQLRTGSKDADWDTMALAFESAINIKSSLKLSRSMVSTAQDSLLHWAAHAQLERMRGRLDEARKVYQTILIASKPARTAIGLSILWWNWAELEWLAGNDDGTLKIILRSVELEDGNSGVIFLRAKRALEDAARTTLLHRHEKYKTKEQEAWVKLRALLEILTTKDVASMLQIFDRSIRADDCPDVASESLLVASMIMLYRYGYVLKNPVPPSILRDRVSEALEVYPCNSIILAIFLECEKGLGVWGRVRGMLGDSETGIGNTKTVARRVEEVWIAGWERGRWRSEIERTRSGLAAAVESERTRASVVVWKIYIEFEMRVGDLQSAKKILYRAIGECPFFKDLYLLAFWGLRSVFTAPELNLLADLMAERGLRLRKGLDDAIEGWGIEEGKEDTREDEEGDGDGEIEERAKELRRLMPY